MQFDRRAFLATLGTAAAIKRHGLRGARRVRHFSLLRSGLRGAETAPCADSIAGHFSKSVRSGAPPVG
jgi:hypothetical protein